MNKVSGAAGAASTQRLPSALRALRHRDYQLFIGGQLISLIGTWMQSVAQAWLIYRLTGSSVLLGLVGFAGQIPLFLLAFVGGAFADRFDRRRILLVTQLLQMVLALTLTALTLTGLVHEWHVFVLAITLGLVSAVDIPTRQAFIVDIVGKADLHNAIALNSSVVTSARIIGPAIAGVLLATVGEGWCFFANAVSYVPVITGLCLMQVVPHAREKPTGSALSHAAEGFHYAMRTAPIRALLLLLALVSVMGIPYMTLMPIFADRVLHGGANAYGVLMGAAGVGSLIGAVSLTTRQGVAGLGRWVAYSAGCFGIALVLFSLSRSFWLSLVLLVPVGCFMMVEMAATNTLVQSMVPDALRGRVMAIYSMMFVGMTPFGALFSGLLANYLGAPLTLALGGGVCIVGAVIFHLMLPTLRSEAQGLLAAHALAIAHPDATTP